MGLHLPSIPGHDPDGMVRAKEPKNRFADVRLVTFDLDDTLVHTLRTVPQRVQTAMEEVTRSSGVAMSAEEQSCAVREIMTSDPEIHLEVLLRAVTNAVGRELSVALVEGVVAAYRRAAYHHDTVALLEPRSGAPETLKRVGAHYITAIVTNGPEALQRAKAAKFGFDRLVDHFVTSERIGVRKPDPQILEYVAREARVPLGCCVHVGDSPADIRGAQAAGMLSILLDTDVPHRDQPRELGPTATITQLSELADLLGTS